MPPRIFLECSQTEHTSLNSGIQRVVRNLVNESAVVGREMKLEIRSVVFGATGWRYSSRLETPAPSGTPVVGDPKSWKVRIKHSSVWGPVLAKPWHVMRKWKASRECPPLDAGMQFGPGDVVVLIDSSWHFPFWPSLMAAKARGAKVGVLIHDLIPLQYPQYCDPTLVMVYKDWWKEMSPKVDFFIGVSEATRASGVDAMTRSCFKEQVPLPKAPPSGVSVNGANFDPYATSHPIREALTSLFAPGIKAPFIVVGTLEPRKNHTQVLDAFELLWNHGSDARLIIIGRFGWKVDELAARIRSHPKNGTQLFWFEDLADSELDFAYRNTFATIAPSIAEGFDLPIVESLSRGRPVLASDIPVHHETAGTHGGYFELHSATKLADLLERFYTQGTLPGITPPRGYRWPTWRESCQNLVDQTLKLSGH